MRGGPWGGGGDGGEAVDPSDRSPAGHLTGAVGEPRGGWCLSIKHPLLSDLQVLRRDILGGCNGRRRGL